jgi:two-component system response regulator FixJ
MPEKVFLVDDDAGIRRVLALLAETIGLESESYSRPSHFLENFSHTGAGCVVADVIMPEMTGIQMLTAARARDINLPFIILTGHADVEVAVTAFRTGAFDFLEKPFSDTTYLAMIQQAINHSRRDLETAEECRAIARRAAILTKRERVVVSEIVRGDSNKEIARKLGLSHRTVERHRQNAIKKLGVRSAGELGALLPSQHHAAAMF